MTEISIPHSAENRKPLNRYAVQTAAQRRNGGGVGKSEKSFHKHEQIEQYMNRQLPVLVRKFGRGCIIDMHAGDGEPTPFPTPDFFAGGLLKTTPHLAIAAAREFGADVILCEKTKEQRQHLQDVYGTEARVIGNHANLLELAELIAAYRWILVLNDPNGHSDQGVVIMQWLATTVLISDFIVVVNCHSIRRCLALKPCHQKKAINAARKSGLDHEWMLYPEQWKAALNKHQVMAGKPIRLSNAMEAQVLLISNWIAGYGK